jgi:hypothetical protein
MAADADLQARVAELEEYTRRVIPARDGTDGWINYIQNCLREEREFSNGVFAHALAMMRDEIMDEVKASIETALARRIRGTHDPKAEYCANDMVAKDGGTFVARRNNPGPCPGDGWQLMAKQGQRGVAGERGAPGRDASRIIKWELDVASYTATPIMSDGTKGPGLELRALFAQSET